MNPGGAQGYSLGLAVVKGSTSDMSERIDKVELIALAIDGLPAETLGELPDYAKEACTATAAHYQRAGFIPPWISYLAVWQTQIVGICAFTGEPKANRVEIAYNTFALFEGRGVATAMVAELILVASETDPGTELFAQTLPEPNASNAVLKKLGFEFFDTVQHGEEGQVWEWRLPPIKTLLPR